MGCAGASSRSSFNSGCRRSSSRRHVALGWNASDAVPEQVSQGRAEPLRGVVNGQVAACSIAERAPGSFVFKQVFCSGGQGPRVIVGYDATHVPQWKPRCGTPHRNDRKVSREGVEHLDRKAAQGAPWYPGKVAGRVCQHSGALRSKPGKTDGIRDAQAFGVLSSGCGVRRGGDEQSRASMTAAQQGNGFDEALPTLVRIEIACIQTQLRIGRDSERQPSLVPWHSIGDRR